MGVAGKARTDKPAVLYVDDEPDNLLVFRANFRRHYEVFTASSPKEALQLLARVPIPVLLTDQRMPDMSGIDLCHHARRIRPDVRLVLVTAFADQETAVLAINRGGVNAFVTKPWSPAQLRETIDAQLETFHLRNELTSLRADLAAQQRDLELSAHHRHVLHDIAGAIQPLAFMVARVERALSQPSPDASVALDGVRRLKVAVSHAIDVQSQARAALEPGNVRLDAVSVPALFDDVRSLAGPKAQALRLRAIAPAGLQVEADRVAVTRILLNLVRNAAEAIFEAGIDDGEVVLEAVESDDVVEIRVRDNGPGVPEAFRRRLFTEGATTRAGGLGIGLHAARTLAKLQGGDLALEDSDGAVAGATFLLTLSPARTETESSSPSIPAP